MPTAHPGAAKEKMFSPWCADPALAADLFPDETHIDKGKKTHQGVASKNPALAQGITWSKSTTALGLPEVWFGNRNGSRCTGKERDSESGLDYFGARYYSNGLGRFVSADWSVAPMPVPYADFGDPQSLNQYTYVRNIPTTNVDTDGHQCQGVCTEPTYSAEVVKQILQTVGPAAGPAIGATGPVGLFVGALTVTVGVPIYAIAQTGPPTSDVDIAMSEGWVDLNSDYYKGQNQQTQTQPQLGQARGAGEEKSQSDIANERARTNGGMADFSNSLKRDLEPGQTNSVDIQYTGSRRADFAAANKASGFKGTPAGYTWHHVPNYNAQTNTGTMQLVKTKAHKKFHHGGVRQFEKAHKKKYRSMMLEETPWHETGSYVC